MAAVGAIGELLSGGRFLAEGYLNLPEVTHAAFIDTPSRENRLSLWHSRWAQR
ncbi:hypothetical protein BJX96DRAFT_159008 [Aspergillus floccosus]